MKIAILTSGYLPIPAVKGGAIENLVENIIKENEKHKKMNINLFSVYDEKSSKICDKYSHTKFYFIKVPQIVKLIDFLIFSFMKYIIRIKKTISYKYVFQRLYYIKSVKEHLRKNDFDKIIIENHPSLFMCLKDKMILKRYKNKYYYHLHNEFSYMYGCKSIIKKCKKILGVSKFVNEKMAACLDDEYNGGKYVVLKNKINRNEFLMKYNNNTFKKYKDEYGIKTDEKVILFTGRITKEKGIKELLLAFKKIKDKNTKLLVVGDYFFGSNISDEFISDLKKMSLDISDRIVFTGYVSYEKLPIIYRIADIVVVPSMWNDPAPLTVVESLTLGKPLITTYSGGISEYANEENSVILKRNEEFISELAYQMENLLGNKTLRLRLSHNALIQTENWTLKEYYDDFFRELSV